LFDNNDDVLPIVCLQCSTVYQHAC